MMLISQSIRRRVLILAAAALTAGAVPAVRAADAKKTAGIEPVKILPTRQVVSGKAIGTPVVFLPAGTVVVSPAADPMSGIAPAQGTTPASGPVAFAPIISPIPPLPPSPPVGP